MNRKVSSILSRAISSAALKKKNNPRLPFVIAAWAQDTGKARFYKRNDTSKRDVLQGRYVTPRQRSPAAERGDPRVASVTVTQLTIGAIATAAIAFPSRVKAAQLERVCTFVAADKSSARRNLCAKLEGRQIIGKVLVSNDGPNDVDPRFFCGGCSPFVAPGSWNPF
jgi:hypothetical protein